jgi:DNA-binding NarL/FixJ family response regulator
MFTYDPHININVLLMDNDYFALQCVTSYLAMDRRTRVVCKAETLEAMWAFVQNEKEICKPRVIVLDADHCGDADMLSTTLKRLHQLIHPLHTLCLSLHRDEQLIAATVRGGASGFLIKSEVRYHIAWVVAGVLEGHFVISPGIERTKLPQLVNKPVVICPREFPDLTPRQRQVLELTLLEGMPAKVVADELGIGYETVRGHIRDGNDVVKSYDNLVFPPQLSKEEQAFMRFTRPKSQ